MGFRRKGAKVGFQLPEEKEPSPSTQEARQEDNQETTYFTSPRLQRTRKEGLKEADERTATRRRWGESTERAEKEAEVLRMLNRSLTLESALASLPLPLEKKWRQERRLHTSGGRQEKELGLGARQENEPRFGVGQNQESIFGIKQMKIRQTKQEPGPRMIDAQEPMSGSRQEQEQEIMLRFRQEKEPRPKSWQEQEPTKMSRQDQEPRPKSRQEKEPTSGSRPEQEPRPRIRQEKEPRLKSWQEQEPRPKSRQDQPRLYHSAPDLGEDLSNPELRLVNNLRYSLEQLRVAGERDSYAMLVNSVVVGPASIRAADLEQLLGINTDLYTKARIKRRQLVEGGLRPSWGEGGLEAKEGRAEPSPQHQLAKPRGKKANRMKFPDLHHQFQLFSKFGESGSDGSQITLTQSDKWLRQAKVIDGWNLTTTDTAIAFRKISRGSIWLEYNPWRQLLEELATRKGLDMQEVVANIF